jgi:hypothetical protein
MPQRSEPSPRTSLAQAYEAKRTRWLQVLCALLGIGFCIRGITLLAAHNYFGAIGPFLVVVLAVLVIITNPNRAPRGQRILIPICWCVVPLSLIFNAISLFQ